MSVMFTASSPPEAAQHTRSESKRKGGDIHRFSHDSDAPEYANLGGCGSQLLAGPQPDFRAKKPVITSMAAFESPPSESVIGSMAAFEELWRPQPPGRRRAIPAPRRWSPAVSRRTPVSCSMRRNVSFRQGCEECLFERGPAAEGSQVPV
jgi:hypothetical protein